MRLLGKLISSPFLIIAPSMIDRIDILRHLFGSSWISGKSREVPLVGRR